MFKYEGSRILFLIGSSMLIGSLGLSSIERLKKPKRISKLAKIVEIQEQNITSISDAYKLDVNKDHVEDIVIKYKDGKIETYLGSINYKLDKE